MFRCQNCYKSESQSLHFHFGLLSIFFSLFFLARSNSFVTFAWKTFEINVKNFRLETMRCASGRFFYYLRSILLIAVGKNTDFSLVWISSLDPVLCCHYFNITFKKKTTFCHCHIYYTLPWRLFLINNQPAT